VFIPFQFFNPVRFPLITESYKQYCYLLLVSKIKALSSKFCLIKGSAACIGVSGYDSCSAGFSIDSLLSLKISSDEYLAMKKISFI
jgi:hypothetical protein